MKAKIKATGEIVEVHECCVDMYLEEAEGSPGRVFHIQELDFENPDYPDYWTRLEHQYAGMAMQGILSNPESELDYEGNEALPRALAGIAAKLAHALVEKMKEVRK